MPVSRRAVLGATGAALLFGVSAGAASASVGPQSDPMDIRALKLLLKGAGVSAVVVNSVFDRTFYSQLVSYQRSHGLPVTGTGDAATTAYVGSRVAVTASSTSYHVSAARVLLTKHGYTFSSGASGLYTGASTGNAQLMRDLTSFRISSGGGYTTNPLDSTRWTELFKPRTRLAAYPMLQQGTGSAQWNNCGPTSAMSILLARGIRPASWNGNAWLSSGVAQHGPAVRDFRYNKIGYTTAYDHEGTEYEQLAPAFAKYGVSTWHGGISDTIAAARQGISSICGGDAGRMPYSQNIAAGARASHWVVVFGVTPGGYFVVADPLTLNKPDSDRLHTVTESQLRTYASSNTGGNAPPSHNSVMFR